MAVIGVLVVLWCYGVYESHWGAAGEWDGYISEELTLVYHDRNLQVVDELAGWPEWCATGLWFASRSEELGVARESLLVLHETGNLGVSGGSALAVICAELGEEPPEGVGCDWLVAELLDGGPASPEALAALERLVANGGAWWWEVALARQRVATGELSGEVLLAEDAAARSLFWRHVVSNGCSWVLVAAGLLLIPRAWRTLGSGGADWDRAVVRSYPWRWGVLLVVLVFVGADLGSRWLVEFGYTHVATEESGFLFDVVMDLGWRLAAPAIALLVLFRRPRHALRTLRLDGPAAWPVVLAMFALLYVGDIGLGYALGWLEVDDPLDPTGGLDAMEIGWAGLGFGLLSACVAAPLGEEIMCRGILLRGLERHLRFFGAAAVVAVVFALGHDYGAAGLVSVGIFGFAAAIVYRVTHSLKATILLHGLYNLSITLPGWWIYHGNI